MNINAYLDSVDASYDPSVSMTRSEAKGGSYHSRMEGGKIVHPVRNSVTYAAYLLRAGGADRTARASDILNAVVRLQDRNPTSGTFGIWPYTLEEPLDQMAPPDWNWADFIGSSIALILYDYAQLIETDLVDLLKAALHNAACEIFRRNIGAGYTNIAIMGAGVCAMAGELLDERFLVRYGKRRLADVLDSVRFHGNFNEYNSPTYTFVALEELAQILYIVEDSAILDTAQRLYSFAWTTVADHFHAGTGQIAGPHSRAYSDRLSAKQAAMIERYTGHRIRREDSGQLEKGRIAAAGAAAHEPPPLFPWAPCPEDAVQGFSNVDLNERIIHDTFVKIPNSTEHIEGSTWFSRDACLGSVSMDSSWTQRHGLIAYWQDRDPVCSCFKPQMLKDRREFASFMLRCRQNGNSVVAGYSPLSNGGDWHLYLDHPEDHRFTFHDLRLRLAVSGTGPRVMKTGGDIYAVASDNRTVVIYPGPGSFMGTDAHWETGSDGTTAWVDAVLYSGKEAVVDFPGLRSEFITFAVELMADVRQSSGPIFEVGDRYCSSIWDEKGLAVDVPLGAERYPMDPDIWKQR